MEDEKVISELFFYNKMHEDFKKIGKQKYSEEDYQDGNLIGDEIHRGAEYQNSYQNEQFNEYQNSYE